MSGKLDPQLAAGKMNQVADEVLQLSMPEVFRDLGPQCTTADVDLIMSAFAAAKQHVKATLSLKLAFWKHPPWMFAALAHPDPAEVRRCAQLCVEHLRANPNPLAHHRLSRKWLPGTHLFAELEAVAAGEHVFCRSLTLQLEVAGMRFLPTNETVIESKHANVTIGKKRNARMGPTLISLSNRWKHIDDHLATAHGTQRLLDAFALARRPALAAGLLGLDGHPRLRDGIRRTIARESKGSGRTRDFLVGQLSLAVYHCDLESQFADAKLGQKAHEQRRDRDHLNHARAAAAQGGQRLTLTLDDIKYAAVVSHFQDMSMCEGQEGAVRIFSIDMPREAGGLRMTSLDDYVRPSLLERPGSWHDIAKIAEHSTA